MSATSSFCAGDNVRYWRKVELRSSSAAVGTGMGTDARYHRTLLNYNNNSAAVAVLPV